LAAVLIMPPTQKQVIRTPWPSVYKCLYAHLIYTLNIYELWWQEGKIANCMCYSQESNNIKTKQKTCRHQA